MKIPNYINIKRNGQYCAHCFSETVSGTSKGDRTYYTCSSCGETSERSLVIDDAIKWWVDDEDNFWHESVGVVVLNDQKEILCLLRKIFPFAYALPAGHLDKNENPHNAALRELKEETGLEVEALQHIKNFEMIGDSCRRGSDHHYWHLYMTKINNADVQLNDEASEYAWFSIDEILKMEHVTFPLRYIAEIFSSDLR